MTVLKRLHADQRVRVTVEEGRVIIAPVQDAPLTLEQRLARFDPARHGGEVMETNAAVGAELQGQPQPDDPLERLAALGAGDGQAVGRAHNHWLYGEGRG
jgi:hypothetical protein